MCVEQINPTATETAIWFSIFSISLIGGLAVFAWLYDWYLQRKDRKDFEAEIRLMNKEKCDD
jgi:hypothetical protein